MPPRHHPPIGPSRRCATRHPLILLACLGLSACGSGGGGPAASGPGPDATKMVTTYYDPPTNTLVASEGPVLVSDGTSKQGPWTFRFPPSQGNGIQFTKTFVAGVWDQHQLWRECNADGSIRIDWTDH